MSRQPAYKPAEGSAAVVCWVVIIGCAAIAVLSITIWLTQPNEAMSFIDIFIPTLVAIGAIARLRGWAPAPKGISGGGGP